MRAFLTKRLTGVLIGLGLLVSVPTWAEEGPQANDVDRSAAVPADPVERRAAEFAERTRRMKLGDADRIREATARRTARTEELGALSVQLSAALALPPASTERQVQLDQTAQSQCGLRSFPKALVQKITMTKTMRKDQCCYG